MARWRQAIELAMTDEEIGSVGGHCTLANGGGPPGHGNVSVKKVNVNATNYKQCLALEVPGYIAFYRAASGFAGTDVVTLEVRFPGGRTELQKITVTVTGASLGL